MWHPKGHPPHRTPDPYTWETQSKSEKSKCREIEACGANLRPMSLGANRYVFFLSCLTQCAEIQAPQKQSQKPKQSVALDTQWWPAPQPKTLELCKLRLCIVCHFTIFSTSTNYKQPSKNSSSIFITLILCLIGLYVIRIKVVASKISVSWKWSFRIVS